LVAPRHAVVALGLALVAQPGVEVGGDAVHMLGAHGLDADLLQSVVDVLRLAAGRAAGGVDVFVMVAQAQRHAVGGATQPGHLGRRQGAGGQRQPGALARHPGGAGLEGNLHIGRLRHGAQGAGGGALEVLGAPVLTAAQDYRPLRVGTPVGMSSLKQR
jgi:hypothetical protein